MSLFNRNPSAKKAAKSVSLSGHPNTPIAAFEDGASKFAEIYGGSLVSSQRMFILAIFSFLVAILGLGTVMVMLPLKEIRPYIVEINPGSGLVNKPVEVEKVAPNMAVVKAELAKWTEAVYTIDPIQTSGLFKYANVRSRGKAIAQFAEFRGRENVFSRIQKEPGLVREVKVSSVDASQKGVAFVFIQTQERAGNQSIEEGRVKRYRLTLHYEIDPPTQQDDLLVNPLGLYVTFFNEAEERAN